MTKTSALYGGKGGVAWDDLADYPNITRMLGFIISGREIIYSIQGVYLLDNGNVWIGKRHGGAPDNTNAQSIGNGYDIKAIIIRSGDVLDSISFELSAGGDLFLWGPYGGTGGTARPQLDMNNLIAFYGRSGTAINALGFHYS